MGFLLLVVLLGLLGLEIYVAKKEPQITPLYKAAGLFGRIYFARAFRH